jgi:Hemerythrin HHE cation binding domain
MRGSLWPPSTRRPRHGTRRRRADQVRPPQSRVAVPLVEELEVHATIEEEIYYPAVEAKARKDGKELIAEAVEEHHVVKVLLSELGSMSSEHEAFDAKVTVLMENVRHHVEEESELLPQSEKILGTDELTRLGEQMAARKQQLGAG